MDSKMALWLLSLCLSAALAVKTFKGDHVISVTATSPAQFEYLKHLERTSELDFWSLPVKVGKAVSIHVTPEQLQSLDQSFMTHGLTYEVKVPDVQRLLNSEKDVTSSSLFNSADVLLRYGSQQEIYSWLEGMTAECGDRCTLMPFGTSVEGKDMKVIKIVAPGSTGSTGNKPVVFVDGGIHAREWISPAFVNNMIDKLINDYNTDGDVKVLLDTYDWYIIPLLNPDGYEYSHASDRMWRKNRASTRKTRCTGVDLNRNFGYQWGVDGVSTNPCSEIYLGPKAFSEPESQALRDFLATLKDRLNVYLSFHSYGQYFLYPWGYGRFIAPNHDDLDEVGKEAAKAIHDLNEKDWIVGNAAIALYPAAGASDDWAYGSAGATYAYCIELPPDDDSTGFILPESEIPGVVNTVWPGIKAMMKTIIVKERHELKAQKPEPSVKGGVRELLWNRMMMEKPKAQPQWELKYL